MLELPSRLLQTLTRLFGRRRELALEYLLLRHQLQIALRSRPRPQLETRDRVIWLVARRLDRGWSVPSPAAVPCSRRSRMQNQREASAPQSG